MAKSPNYQFERRERDRLKANKSAEKAASKREQQDLSRDRAAQTEAASSESEKT